MRATLSAMLVAALGTAAVDAQPPEIVYRAAPPDPAGTVTNMTNKDTTDVNGGVVPNLLRLTFPFWCAANPNVESCKGAPPPDAPNNDVIHAFLVEYSPPFGDYNLCTPSPSNGTFSCVPSNSEPGNHGCWWDAPNSWQWEGTCDDDTCYCPMYEEQAVGREVCPLCGWPINPLHAPPQCDPFYVAQRTAWTGATVSLTVPHSSSVACCEACTKTGPSCVAATYEGSNRTCTLYNDTTNAVRVSAPDAIAFERNDLNGTAVYWLQRFSILSAKLNGSWFSTRREGECGPCQQPGDGCFWKMKHVLRTIDASCASSNIVRYMRDKYPACWEQNCDPREPLTSLCSMKCLFNTAASPRTPSWDIANGFRSSFQYSDPSLYGCPDAAPPIPPHNNLTLHLSRRT
eukprot:Rhum_TRINITY_DN1366_c0_g1::Rhum_TRINITY_DN1366_c0_g1_i1::g.4038::m.4038